MCGRLGILVTSCIFKSYVMCDLLSQEILVLQSLLSTFVPGQLSPFLYLRVRCWNPP